MEATRGEARAVRRMFEVPTVVLEFFPGLLGLYETWRYYNEAVLLLPVGLDVFCKLNLEVSPELYSTMQNSDFHHASKNGLTVFSENPKTQEA
jgi:hypothetical protein